MSRMYNYLPNPALKRKKKKKNKEPVTFPTFSPVDVKIPGISYELQERYNAQSFKIGKMQREKGREPRRGGQEGAGREGGRAQMQGRSSTSHQAQLYL